MSLEVLPLRSWTREEFGRAVEAGVFRPDERLELLDGQIVSKMTHNAPHVACTHLVSDWLRTTLPDGWAVRTQAPISLGERSQPEPDVAVVRGSTRDFATQHPEPHQIALLVEVSDSTLREDRRYKTSLYGAAGIGEFWIVDLNHRRLIVHLEPEHGEYRLIRVLRPEEEVAPIFAPDRRLQVNDLLP